MTEEAIASLAGPLLPAASEIALAARLNTTVPSEQEETVIVIKDPELAEGAKTQPVAVPVLLKSEAVRLVTLFEKARV
jgi:hypothetical protein